MDTEVNLGAKSSAARSLMGMDDHGMHKDIPSDSPSRSSNSLPTYHFHGLAATQTQTPQNEETTFEINDSSQKENISGRSRVNGDDTSSDPDSARTFEREVPPKAPTIRVPPADQAIPTPSPVTKVLLPPFAVFINIHVATTIS
jgi:hypothetical protein